MTTLVDFLSLPANVISSVCAHLIEEPKDLANLRAVCKKTNAVLKECVFQNLLDLCRETVAFRNEDASSLMDRMSTWEARVQGAITAIKRVYS